MELSIYITYIIPSLIFGPVFFLYYRKSDNFPENLRLLVLGGFGWAVLALLMVIPFSFVIESSTEVQFLEVFDVNGEDNRTPLFWLLFVFSVMSEIIKFRLVMNEENKLNNYQSLAIFGFFWGFLEFLSRFSLFFTDIGDNILSLLFLFCYIVLVNIGLSMIILRTEENTKFVMFSSIMRFFTELALFGAFGHLLSEGERISRLSFVIILHLFIVYLSVLTRKPVVNK